ncbi:MAG: hypothetical protein ACHQTE_02210 [Candidatus Saccharimonadales bacterium]
MIWLYAYLIGIVVTAIGLRYFQVTQPEQFQDDSVQDGSDVQFGTIDCISVIIWPIYVGGLSTLPSREIGSNRSSRCIRHERRRLGVTFYVTLAF